MIQIGIQLQIQRLAKHTMNAEGKAEIRKYAGIEKPYQRKTRMMVEYMRPFRPSDGPLVIIPQQEGIVVPDGNFFETFTKQKSQNDVWIVWSSSSLRISDSPFTARADDLQIFSKFSTSQAAGAEGMTTCFA
jgi:hypothetical protein